MDTLLESVSVALLGIAVVFISLCLLAGSIKVMSYFMKAMSAKKAGG